MFWPFSFVNKEEWRWKYLVFYEKQAKKFENLEIGRFFKGKEL